jgi:hypothetical protein
MKVVAGAILVGASLAPQAWAQCDQPAVPTVPDGATSTLDEMLEAQTAVRAYMAEMESFLECVGDEIDSAPADTPEEMRAVMVQRYDTAFDEMEAVAASFNAERIAYTEANADED